MSKTCVRHREAPAATMCHQCHSPICTPCSIVTPRGTFCSPECGVLFREFKEKAAVPETGGMPRLEVLLKLVLAGLLLCVGFYGIHVAAGRVPALRKADVIGLVLQFFSAREKGQLD